MPKDAFFETISERPGNRLGIYWHCSTGTSKPISEYVQYTNVNAAGKPVTSGEVPGHRSRGNGVCREDWNARGQHAYLPDHEAYITNYLRLKGKGGYRALMFLPRFDTNTLQDLRFSPDGECLYVLGDSKLWIIGAQSARLLRVVEPVGSKCWSDENAVLSSDCRRILGMRGKMMLYSTRTGKVSRRFGTRVKSQPGSCGEISAGVFFSRDGHWAVETQDEEGWIYPASGGSLQWQGETPLWITQTARGHFFLDVDRVNTPVLRRWRDGKIGWHLKLGLGCGDCTSDPVFSRDGRWVYFIRDRSVWRVAMPKLS